MKKAEVFILTAVLLAAVVFLIVLRNQKNGHMAVLYADRKEIGRYTLDDDRIIPVMLEDGYNLVVISGGEVLVEEADCNNQICVNTPPIGQVGETIVCLPHRFYVIIE